jgi:hypothetical protein
MCTTLVVAVVVRFFLWPYLPRAAITPLALGLGLAVATLVFPYANNRSVTYSLFLGLTVAGTQFILATYFAR